MLDQGRIQRTIAGGALIATVVAAVGGGTALAAAPANDDRGAAKVVGDLPYEDTLDTAEATSQQNDPDDCLFVGPSPTVWYSFTPANDGVFVASTVGSDYDTTLTVGVIGSGGFQEIDCSDDADDDDFTSRVGFRGQAGREYLLMAGSAANETGSLHLALRRAPPPPTFDLRIARTGTVTRQGTAEIHGSLRCDGTDASQGLDVSGRQDMERRIIRGFGWRRVDCDAPWTIKVRNRNFRYAAGPILIHALVQWCDGVRCTSERAQRNVRLR